MLCSKPTVDASTVEPAQQNVSNLLVKLSFSFNEGTIQQICSTPDLAVSVMVKRRRAEVKVSTLSDEQKREQETAKDKELDTFGKYSWSGIASKKLDVCPHENALACDTQG